MKQMLPPPLFRLALLLGLLLMRSAPAAWAQSATYQVPLGQAAVYGLLSGGTITAQNLAGAAIPIQVCGKAGASGSIGAGAAATAGVFAQGGGTVPQALSSLQAAQSYCSLPRSQSRTLAGQLTGSTLTQGVYTIGSSATLSQGGALTISGDTATVIIVNVAGDLILEAGSHVVLQGVLPQHVYWNVAGGLRVAGRAALMGNALVTSNALVDGVQLGYAAILSRGQVTLTNISPSVGHNLFFAPAGRPATACSSPGPSCTFTPRGSELIVDGSLEYYACCPTGHSGLSILPAHTKPDACFWQSATGGTADYFNACATFQYPALPGYPPTTYPASGVPVNYANTIATRTANYTYQVPALAQDSRATTGEGYAGIYAQQMSGPRNYYEYIYQTIATGLQLNRRYYAEFSAHLAQQSESVVSTLGMLVEPDNTGPQFPLSNTDYLIPRPPTISGDPRYRHPKNPNPPAQNVADSLNWQRIGGVFTADANMASATALRVVIGNFGDSTQLSAGGPGGNGGSAYYFIDNVSLSPLTEAGPDVVLGASCAGSSGPGRVTLGTAPMPRMVAATYRWTLPNGTVLATTPDLTVAPAQTTTYVLTVTINGQNYASQATVTVNNSFGQNAAATYVAPAGAGPAEIGQPGRVTTIDASAPPYRGQVVFDGTYHVLGTVHLLNGSFELRPGTTFLVDGPSGLPYSSTSGDTDLTTLVVQNGGLVLSGATLRAACGSTQWGGVWLERRGALRTAAGGGVRSRVQDARTGVRSRAGNEYYLADTDFRHNDCGLRELATDKVANAGEGVQRCTFRDGLYGIVLEETDYYQNGSVFGGDYGALRQQRVCRPSADGYLGFGGPGAF